MQNPDGSLHPATVQHDIVDTLTPGTVIYWLTQRHNAAVEAGDNMAAMRLRILIDSAHRTLGV